MPKTAAVDAKTQALLQAERRRYLLEVAKIHTILCNVNCLEHHFTQFNDDFSALIEADHEPVD